MRFARLSVEYALSGVIKTFNSIKTGKHFHNSNAIISTIDCFSLFFREECHPCQFSEGVCTLLKEFPFVDDSSNIRKQFIDWATWALDVITKETPIVFNKESDISNINRMKLLISQSIKDCEIIHSKDQKNN